MSNPSSEKSVLIEKPAGQTPLEALEDFRSTRPDLADVPLTYAGRLDPMAEGKLVILIGDECKKKDEYLSFDKEYEVEIVFGISTDSMDALGVPIQRFEDVKIEIDFESHVGKFTQKYPPYSSKTVNGIQLHELARKGELPEADEMPEKEVEIYSIDKIGERDIPAGDLLAEIEAKIAQVKGDFRQAEIVSKWRATLAASENDEEAGRSFRAISIRVDCSSGTYMRSLAHRIGRDVGAGAFALSIKRTKIIQKRL